MRHGAASRLAGPPTTGAELADPVTTSPGRASSQATHGVDRPRGPRYNIAGSRLVSGHPRSRPPSRSPLQHRRVAPRLRPPAEHTALARPPTTSPGRPPPPAPHGVRPPPPP